MRSLVKRGYNIGLIDSIFKKVKTLSQDELIKEKPKRVNNRIPFIIPFNTNTTVIGHILRTHWHHIANDEELAHLQEEEPVLALKRNRNLRDSLVHSKFK